MNTQIESTQHFTIEVEQYVDSIFYLKIENSENVFFENLVKENEIDSTIDQFV